MNKLLFTTLLLIFLRLTTFAQNPIVQTNYTADPAPMVHNDTVYLYTTHDEDITVRNFFTMNDWRCYSSTDMVNWTDHGTVLSYNDFRWSRGDAWAGQCIFRNGKFYFYVPVNQKNGGNAIGVAVSDSPTGPFKDALGGPLLTGGGYIDPTVFIDDDGQAYLYWGNPNLWYVKLNEDMVSFDKETGVVKVPLTSEGFHVRFKDVEKRPSSYEEGPWIYKRKELYYLLYPAGGVPEHLAYSTGKTVTGPWIYRDTIMHVIKEKGAFTNHPGIIDFKGKSYLFYHTGALPGGGGYKRSVSIEPVNFNRDGTIPVIDPTKEGVIKSASVLNPYNKVEAETIAWAEGVKTALNATTGIFVTDISDGDYIKVRSVDFRKGAGLFEASTATISDSAKIEIHLDSPDGTTIGTCLIRNSGEMNKWMVQSCSTQKVKGVHDVYFVFRGSNDDLFDFDWWSFKQ
ncbi:MAG TPA: glycoside hydrolase family 43 protein [Bacteroidales bacterium]|nr:glycoside hydrolase family 43 protein [Bacteroidales bacterium]